MTVQLSCACCLGLALLLIPSHSFAAERVYELWEFMKDEDIDAWHYVGLDEGELMSEGLRFNVKDRAVIFRPLPEGFHQHVDALRFRWDATGLDEVAVLFLTLDDDGQIAKRFRLSFPVSKGPTNEYIPIDFYRKDIEGSDVLAVTFVGNANNVVFDSVRFLHYTLFEKIRGVWESFADLQPLTPYSINILLGPTITSDIGSYRDYRDWRQLSLSLNAYLLVGIALFSIALLFVGLARTRRGAQWEDVRGMILRTLFAGIFAVWILYDVRMGAEFIANVFHDRSTYFAAEPAESSFRDIGKFPAFVAFAKPFLKEEEAYEFFVPDRWPYFGMMRYETYPALPNPGDPVSDLWVVFSRTDMSIDEENRLLLAGKPITAPGILVARFDAKSFIFRGAYAP
ncbi:MAG TPA: hypothetical protein VJB82_00230 [Candidatus Peribacterales bacterium]|nr:hypothetical protein [Candidatus Peribacterales bacterium]